MGVCKMNTEDLIDKIIEICDKHIQLDGIFDPSGNAETYIENTARKFLKQLLEQEAKDKLDLLFKHQYNLMEKIGTNPIGDVPDEQFIRLIFIGIVTEACEMLEETPWKPWKQTSKLNLNNAQEEAVDILFFLLELLILLGFTPDTLFNEYKKKLSINMQRQDSNEY